MESDLNTYSQYDNAEWVKQLIDLAITFRDQRKVRIFCGEFGAFMQNSNNFERCGWYKLVRQYLELNNIPWTTWDYKGGLGLFNNGSDELFDNDLNVSLPDSLGLKVPEQVPFVIRPDSSGFTIYGDYIDPGILNSSNTAGTLNFYCTNLPEAGSYCINWYGFSQYNTINFDFVPDKDLSRLVAEDYALNFMVRGSEAGIKFDIRFRDSKIGSDDHPWRMGTTIDGTNAKWDLKWHLVRIPLSSFIEQGAWDNNKWYNPEGKFDWTKVDVMEISTEYSQILGKYLWFDNVNISNLDTAVVRADSISGLCKIVKL